MSDGVGSGSRLRVGVIGAGTIAVGAHLPAILRLRDRLELVAVADVRAEAAKEAAERFGAAHAYTDTRELLDRSDIDAVVICTPEFLHAGQTLAAAAAGKHVLCEKPMAATVAEADAMLDACQRAGVRLMIGHSRRFTPRYQRIREAIDRGDIGEVRLVRENERRPIAMYTAQAGWAGYWAPDAGGDNARPWLEQAAYSQGAALTNAVHEMDLIRWFVGAEAVSVYAESRITDPNAEVPDFITASIRFANGALGATEVVNRLPPGYPVYHLTEVFGRDGLVRALDPAMATLAVTDPTGTTFPANWGTLLQVPIAYEAQLRGFAAAIAADGPVPLDPFHARQALALSLAAVRSSRESRVVRLDEGEEDAATLAAAVRRGITGGDGTDPDGVGTESQ
ncbi:MAG: Gfo/Idh/MocA family oxidoreductase [Chloroflexota bacterium]|nr:Gfo/Idh/MocA family oxidoreductase [Chloroflexota bacterium]